MAPKYIIDLINSLIEFLSLNQFLFIIFHNTAVEVFVETHPVKRIAAGEVQVWKCSRAHLTPLTLPKHGAEKLLTATSTVDRNASIQALNRHCVIYVPLEATITIAKKTTLVTTQVFQTHSLRLP